MLKNLGYMVGNEDESFIFTTSTNIPGGMAGKLKVKYEPCNFDGEDIDEDEIDVVEPTDLIGKEIFLRVEVEGCSNLPADLSKDVFVSYIFKHEPEIIHRVPAYDGKTCNPSFNYKKVHRIDEVNDYMLDYFVNGNVSTPDPPCNL